jgi:crossover junction endodeoxyribonuclease RusA
MKDVHTIGFFVPGTPATAGSKRHVGNGIIIDSCERNQAWVATVAAFCRQSYQGPPLTGPLCFTADFYLERPGRHFGTGRNAGQVKPSAPAYPTVKPDLLKLTRAVEDALSKIAYGDDAQICNERMTKRYCDDRHPTPGVQITITRLDADKEVTHGPSN